MVKRGQGGKIINIASHFGRCGEPLVSVYCATKAAVISLPQSAGLDLIKYKINVNDIAPAVVETPMWGQVDALFARYENRPIGEKKRVVGDVGRSAGWAFPTSRRARLCSLRHPTPITSWRRRSMSMAGTG